MKNISKILVSAVILSGIFLASPVEAGGSPKIYTLSKYAGKPGTLVKIKGKNFGKSQGNVIFDGVEKVSIKDWSKKRVYFYVPDIDSQESYRVRVCKRGGKCSKSQKFYLTRKGPEINVIKNLSDKHEDYSPSVGDKIKVTGRNFDGQNIKAYLGETEVRITSRTKKWLTFYVPNGIATNKSYTVMITDGENDSNTQDVFVK